MPGPAAHWRLRDHRSRRFCRRGLRLDQQRFRLRRRANAKLVLEPAREAAVPAHRRGAIATGDVRDDPQLRDPFVERVEPLELIGDAPGGSNLAALEGLLGNSERASHHGGRNPRALVPQPFVELRRDIVEPAEWRTFDVVERVGQLARAILGRQPLDRGKVGRHLLCARTHGLTVGDHVPGAGERAQFVQRLAQAGLGLLLAAVAPQQVGKAIPRDGAFRQGNERKQGPRLARFGSKVVAGRTDQAHGAKQGQRKVAGPQEIGLGPLVGHQVCRIVKTVPDDQPAVSMPLLPRVENLHLHQIANPRERAALADGPLRELRRDIERFELDQLVHRQMAVADPLEPSDIVRTDVQGFQLHQILGRNAPVADPVEAGDIGGVDVQRLELHQLVGRHVGIAHAREGADPFRRDVHRAELDQIVECARAVTEPRQVGDVAAAHADRGHLDEIVDGRRRIVRRGNGFDEVAPHVERDQSESLLAGGCADAARGEQLEERRVVGDSAVTGGIGFAAVAGAIEASASRIRAKRSGRFPEARNPARSSPVRSASRKELDQLSCSRPLVSLRKSARMEPLSREGSSVKCTQSGDSATQADDTVRQAQHRAKRNATQRFISGLLGSMSSGKVRPSAA